jgi:membrane protease YdiL (CAAX protease family)
VANIDTTDSKTSEAARRRWSRWHSVLLVLSVLLPLADQGLELWAGEAVFEALAAWPALAVDAIPLTVAVLGLAAARLAGIRGLGLDPRATRLDGGVLLLFVLAIARSVVMAEGISRGPGGYSFLTTSVAEEVICRGVWLAVVAAVLGSDSRRLVSAPVLMSALFFAVWHVSPAMGWPGLWVAGGGFFQGLFLSMLRARSGSLYPGVAAHSINLLLV